MLNLLNLATTLNKLDLFLVIQNEFICNTHESKPKNIQNECKHKHHVKMKTCINIIKNLQNLPHNVLESQITKNKFEITKLGFYISLQVI